MPPRRTFVRLRLFRWARPPVQTDPAPDPELERLRDDAGEILRSRTDPADPSPVVLEAALLEMGYRPILKKHEAASFHYEFDPETGEHFKVITHDPVLFVGQSHLHNPIALSFEYRTD